MTKIPHPGDERARELARTRKTTRMILDYEDVVLNPDIDPAQGYVEVQRIAAQALARCQYLEAELEAARPLASVVPISSRAHKVAPTASPRLGA